MEEWQRQIIVAAGTSAISVASTLLVLWGKNRAKERTNRADHEALKLNRRLTGSKHDEAVDRAGRVTDLIIKHKDYQITPDEFDEYSERLFTPKKRGKKIVKVEPRKEFTTEEKTDLLALQNMVYDALPKNMPSDSIMRTAKVIVSQIYERGPNHLPVGYDEEENKVEWIPDEEEPGEYWDIGLLRNSKAIHAAEHEFFNKVWYNRHIIGLQNEALAKDPNADLSKIETTFPPAKKLEEKYGKENLVWDDFDWGMLNGKLSALRWVTGDEWDFLDT